MKWSLHLKAARPILEKNLSTHFTLGEKKKYKWYIQTSKSLETQGHFKLKKSEGKGHTGEE